jgi:hypothetical protein
MAQLVKQNVLIPLSGLSQDAESNGSTLGEDTVNFYPDGEGYLVNYPGRVPYFRSDLFSKSATSIESAGSVAHAQDVYTTRPTGEFTRITIYRDSSGQQHIVFVVDNTLCVAEGNGYRTLYKFSGVKHEGRSYPDIFVHENRLVVANLGDPVVVWDGFRDVVPLGVTEIPNPPQVSVSGVPWYTDVGDYNVNDYTTIQQHSSYHPSFSDGWKADRYGYWGNPAIWYSGPIDYEPGGTYHGLGGDESQSFEFPGNWNNTKWSWKVRYFDRNGNLGPASAASKVVTIPKNKKLVGDKTSSLADFDGKHFATVFWDPPRNDWHIAGAILYKTLDLHEDKANSQNVYYQEYVQNNVSCSRHTSIAGDSTLANAPLMDGDVTGPPSTDLGASWGNRIIMRDPMRKEVMLYSDSGQPGQFRSSNVYKARDTIEALLPMGDRLLIVTNSTSEVLYYTNDGFIAHLETHENKGSHYGRSFASFGDNIFGLFNDGFFLFNGQKFVEVPTPYFLKRDYIDRWHDVQKAVVQGEWYFLATRKEMVDSENNYILMCNMPTGRWFQVSESVRDMVVSGDYILGVNDNVYFLYRGNDYPESTVHLNGVLNSAGGIIRESTLSNISLFLEPSSKKDVTVKVSGANTFDSKSGSAVSYPAKSTVSKSIKYYPYYNDGVSSWDDSEWVAPNDFHIEVDLDQNITSFKHDIKFSFTGPQRVKAIGIEYGVGSDIASTE